VLKISVGGYHVTALGENKTSLDVSIPSRLQKQDTDESEIIPKSLKAKKKRRLSNMKTA